MEEEDSESANLKMCDNVLPDNGLRRTPLATTGSTEIEESVVISPPLKQEGAKKYSLPSLPSIITLVDTDADGNESNHYLGVNASLPVTSFTRFRQT